MWRQRCVVLKWCGNGSRATIAGGAGGANHCDTALQSTVHTGQSRLSAVALVHGSVSGFRTDERWGVESMQLSLISWALTQGLGCSPSLRNWPTARRRLDAVHQLQLVPHAAVPSPLPVQRR